MSENENSTCENCAGNEAERPAAEDRAACLARRRRLLAAFSYVGALFIVPLLLVEKDADVRFHVRQGAVMCAAELFAGLVGWIPLIGWSVALVVYGLAAFAFVRALQGKRWEIPVVSDYATRLEF